MRYLIKYSKDANIKFVSHLDLMRTLQRIVRRADLPVEYSKGFNPHMNLSIAQPLSVGMYSIGEYMDVVLMEEVECSHILNTLNENAPAGIKIIEVVNVKGTEKLPQSMALIDAAKYSVQIKYKNTESLMKDINELMNKTEWLTIKKGKKGDKEINIRPLIKDISYELQDGKLLIEAILSCGSREHLSAELLARFIQGNTNNTSESSFVDIKREEIYAYKNKKLLSLAEYVIQNNN